MKETTPKFVLYQAKITRYDRLSIINYRIEGNTPTYYLVNAKFEIIGPTSTNRHRTPTYPHNDYVE